MRLLIVFYSAFGHMYRMAMAAAEGAAEVQGAEVVIRQVPETLSEDASKRMGSWEARKAFSHVPACKIEELADFDAIIFGTPTRFGNMCGQMKAFLDSAVGLWSTGALVGKVASVFTGSATQHGGQESTILSAHIPLLHFGCIIVGLPYSFEGQSRMDEITGGSPYGASTIAGRDGKRMPSDNELAAIRFQGRHVATIAAKLAAG
jgi:NAD(P)H dehydrogenase (quinone)